MSPARRRVPHRRYDERFTGYGKNKIEHVTHLRWAGWSFGVLPNDCFVTHFPHPISAAKRDWLGSSALHHGVDKLYATFTSELEAKYGPGGGPKTKLCSFSAQKRIRGRSGHK